MQVLVTAALLLVLGAALLVHGLGTADVAAGLAGGEELERALSGRFRAMDQVLGWLPLVPAMIGLFWGAPALSREFERGTHVLAWTQSVPRRRWLFGKLGGLALAAAAGGLVLGAMINGWLATFDGTRFADRFNNVMFMATGVASAAWWLLAFMLGATTGAFVRRLLPAMAVTLAAYAVAFVAMSGSPLFDVRAHYATPERIVVGAGTAGVLAVGKTVDSQWLDVDGRELSESAAATAAEAVCPEYGPRYDFTGCLYERGYQQAWYIHPPSRYWRFQWTEAGILFVASLGLAGLIGYRVLRRPVQ